MVTEDVLAAVDEVIRALLAYTDQRCPETFAAMVLAAQALKIAREKEPECAA